MLKYVVILLSLVFCAQAQAFSDLRVERRQLQEMKSARQIQGTDGKRYSVDGHGAVYSQGADGQWTRTTVTRATLGQGSGAANRSTNDQIKHVPAQLYYQKTSTRR